MVNPPIEAPRVLLTGGGTGGHIYPALSLAAALRDQRPRVRFLFLGGDRMEARIVPQSGIPFRAISVHGLAGRGLSGLPRRLRSLAELSLGLPLLQSLAALRRFRPHVVVGTGGYVSGPVILAARLLGIPSLALEGNRTPGWTSRALAKIVDAVAVAHPGTALFFASRVRRGVPVVVTGLPVRRSITTLTREAGAAALGLDPALTTLLVLGGSLGSRRLNEALLDALTILKRDGRWEEAVQVVHVTGERYAPSGTAKSREDLPPHYHAFPYLGAKYPESLAAADLVVSRAGAGAVAEITARGLPAVLVPWSGAATGEQLLNAESLARAGAAEVIPDRELTSQRLSQALERLLREGEARGSMAEASRNLGRPNAAADVAALALALADGKKRSYTASGRSSGGRSA